MKNPDEVQPLDDYVKKLLVYAKHFRLRIDPENATRRQRLDAALAYHDSNDPRSAIEIMLGKRVDESSREARGLGLKLAMLKLNPNQDLERFYGCIQHGYYPRLYGFSKL